MTDDQAHDDPLGLALSVLTPEQRDHFGQITDDLVQAADAAAVTPGWTVRPAAASWRMLAAHFKSINDPVWVALSAAAARAEALDVSD
jgi:hypothetical protein